MIEKAMHMESHKFTLNSCQVAKVNLEIVTPVTINHCCILIPLQTKEENKAGGGNVPAAHSYLSWHIISTMNQNAQGAQLRTAFLIIS